jgi:hypothetical protein
VLSQLGRLLALLVLACAFAPRAAPQALDSWAPQGSRPPVGLIVNDPIRGVIPFPPVHATLLPDGRVMLFATTNIAARAAWFTPGPIGEEPPPLVVLQPDNVPVDVDPPLDFTDASGLQWHIEETLFCSGHTLTADGSLFSAGGTLLYSIKDPSTQTTVNYIYGMPQATLYSYPLHTWFRQQNMLGTGESGMNTRWYGTVTRLANQLMLVSSGYELASVQVRRPNQPTEHHPGTPNRSVEIWLPTAQASGGARAVVSTHAETPREIWNPDYTHAFQVPYGPPVVPPNTVLMFGDAGVPVYFLSDAPAGSRWVTQSATPRPGARSTDAPNHGTASVLLPMRASNFEWGYANGSVMQAGGGRESQMERSIDFFEISSGSWGQGADLGVRRRYPATVLLPDGKVIVASGYDATGANPLLGNAHYLDLRPPITPTTTLMTGTAASGDVRGYHNVALLLPDGRVFIGGGRSMGEAGPEDEKPSFRYLYPPYLSPRESPPPRPVITAAPATIGYGSSFSVEFSGGPVGEVVLMGLGSMTHAFDTNQRYVQLATPSQSANAVQVSGPPDVQTAPPGHYMLFVLDANRVPSVARIVRLAP